MEFHSFKINMKLDKITLDIIWGKLQATSDEMGVVLEDTPEGSIWRKK